MIFICYPKCTTCQKARAWLDEHHITYNFRDIKLENPTYDELAAWHEHSGLPLKKSAIQIYGAKGQVAPNERGRDAKAPRHRRHARQASASGER